MMKILITAGPTREPIDAVRYLSNRSSGAIGAALVAEAVTAAHHVTLLLGPVTVDLPEPSDRFRVHGFESSVDLQRLLQAHFDDCDVLIMAAAVADYRPAQTANGKLPRHADTAQTLHLEPTPDLVAQLASTKRADQRIIAFALEEPAHLEQRALAKLRQKRVDAVVANPLDTMESDVVTATWLTAGEDDEPVVEALGVLSKGQFARWLIQRLETWAGR